MNLTTVYRVDTEETYSYTLSPDQAVICAFEQIACNNYYTWRYVDPKQHKGYRRTKHGHYCNGFWAKHHES
jgi:hypothetical protein